MFWFHGSISVVSTDNLHLTCFIYVIKTKNSANLGLLRNSFPFLFKNLFILNRAYYLPDIVLRINSFNSYNNFMAYYYPHFAEEAFLRHREITNSLKVIQLVRDTAGISIQASRFQSACLPLATWNVTALWKSICIYSV